MKTSCTHCDSSPSTIRTSAQFSDQGCSLSLLGAQRTRPSAGGSALWGNIRSISNTEHPLSWKLRVFSVAIGGRSLFLSEIVETADPKTEASARNTASPAVAIFTPGVVSMKRMSWFRMRSLSSPSPIRISVWGRERSLSQTFATISLAHPFPCFSQRA